MRKGKIVSLYQLRPTDGEVGIEIEMEGVGLGLTQETGARDPNWSWAFKADGSLRGESCEWVLYRPVSRNKVNEVLSQLWDTKNKVSALFKPSRRCGVHIHMNVQQMTEQQVWNLIGTYLAFENILIRWAGDSREGNLFCLRASDARELIDMMARARGAGAFLPFMNDQVRYASVNINSIGRYGSLEFRALGTPDQPQRIAQWIRMLYCIRDLSLEFKDLKELLYTLSASNATEFVTKVFGPRSVLRHLPDLEEMLKDGMRNVQDILITQSSGLRNLPNLPGPGWHVYDENDPDAFRKMQVRQRAENLRFYADNGDAVGEDPEPDFDEFNEEEEI